MEFREMLIKKWHNKVKQLKIPCVDAFNVVNIIGNQIKIRGWVLKGLPQDPLSIENAIFLNNSNKFPLIIDPQEQANKWIKSLEKTNDINVTKFTNF